MKKWVLLLFIIGIIGWYIFVVHNVERTAPSEVLAEPVYENVTPPQVFFCPRENCSQVMIDTIKNASSVDCAFYETNYLPLLSLLLQKNARIVIDDSEKQPQAELDVHPRNSPGLMHNKFCILDNKTVITGSTNPTVNGFFKNNNNLLIIRSAYLAKNYNAEFEELWNSRKNAPVEYPIIYLNGFRTENYFCPDDSCQEHVLHTLREANHSIIFMLYSFTDDQIGKLLIEKKTAGIHVAGIMEKQGSGSEYSQYALLKEQGIPVSLDKNPSAFHHKVFIIDNRTVITGSFNPSKNANKRNDENIIITEYPLIVQKYREEWLLNEK